MKKERCFSHFSLALGMLAALTASCLLSAPAGFAQNGLPMKTAAPVRLTVAPNVSSPISMRTLPNAACVLHVEGMTDAQHKLFADDEGMIRFYVHPSAESEGAAHFELDCAADGKITMFPLHLRSSSSPTAAMPAPAEEIAKTRPGAWVRAALTEDEASQLSTEELAMRGYPIRPDPKQAPDAFATWRKAVTKASTFVPARLVIDPGVTHITSPVIASPRKASPSTDIVCLLACVDSTANWSGYVLQGPAGSYDLVEGLWNVPAVQPEHDNQNTACCYKTVYSSYWIGLNGYGNPSPLVQDGTEQDVTDYYVTVCIPFTSICTGEHYDVYSYVAWTEIVPQQPSEEVISSVAVDPGDEIYSEVWLGNPGGFPTAGGADGFFYIENLTRSEYTLFHQPIVTTPTDVGSTAEWIMERPTVNGALPDLADYGVASMSDAYALSTTGNWVCYDCAANDQVWMYEFGSTGDLLSEVYPATASSMEFIWTNFH
jgi:hypothetical protein